MPEASVADRQVFTPSLTSGGKRLAVLFSGQGGQQRETLQRLKAEAEGELAAALAAIIPELWQDSPDSALQIYRNRLAQPLIFGYQMMLWRQLQGLMPRPVAVAGYSLGEMAACCAAGAFPASAGVSLCALRAELMDSAFPVASGLLAIVGLRRQQAEAIAAGHGLELAIVNGPRHFVLGGAQAALAEAERQALAQGAERTVVLPVATPAHTPLLAAASCAFHSALAPWDQPGRLAFPVLSAIDGRAATQRPAALAALARQISTPLDWTACLADLVEMQPDRVLEIGPGNALCRLLEEIAPGIAARATGDFRSAAGIQQWLH